MTADDPFATLGIAPTLDVGAIKRGYFAALAKSPPHADPAGFRMLRDAYERLLDPSRRALAFLRAPIDETDELAKFEARWGARVAEASRAGQRAREGERRIERFLRRISSMTLDEVVAGPSRPRSS